MDMLCQNGGILQALNVNTYGNGTETMVLSHGFGETQDAWKFLVPALACYLKVVVFDMVFSADVDPNLYDPTRYINDTGYTGGFTEEAIENLLRAINNNFTDWAQKFAVKAVGVNESAAVAQFRGSLERMNKETAFSVAKTAFYSDYREVLSPVSVPYTIIQSKRDIVVPEFVAHYMESKLGDNAQVEILNVTGHFPHLTAHALLLKVLKQVLQLEKW